jgi:hypothetical protein
MPEPGGCLVVEVWDHDTFGGDDFLGEVVIKGDDVARIVEGGEGVKSLSFALGVKGGQSAKKWCKYVAANASIKLCLHQEGAITGASGGGAEDEVTEGFLFKLDPDTGNHWAKEYFRLGSSMLQQLVQGARTDGAYSIIKSEIELSEWTAWSWEATQIALTLANTNRKIVLDAVTESNAKKWLAAFARVKAAFEESEKLGSPGKVGSASMSMIQPAGSPLRSPSRLMDSSVTSPFSPQIVSPQRNSRSPVGAVAGAAAGAADKDATSPSALAAANLAMEIGEQSQLIHSLHAEMDAVDATHTAILASTAKENERMIEALRMSLQHKRAAASNALEGGLQHEPRCVIVLSEFRVLLFYSRLYSPAVTAHLWIRVPTFYLAPSPPWTAHGRQERSTTAAIGSSGARACSGRRRFS